MILSSITGQPSQAHESAERFRTQGARAGFVEKVRTTQLDDLDQPVIRFRSPQGGEPLRDLLRRARPGEEIILASYELFQKVSPFREFGPVFLSATESSPDSDHSVFSSGYFTAELALRAYDDRGWIQQAEKVAPTDAPSVVASWLGLPSIQFVDARFLAYGCFACRFTRSSCHQF